jgi:hypothetical protein
MLLRFESTKSTNLGRETTKAENVSAQANRKIIDAVTET